MSVSYGELLSHLQANSPGFSCSVNDIELLAGPEEFYQALLEKTERSNSRIVISVLYFGTGERERILRDAIWNALKRGVQVTIFMDEARGTRGARDGRDSVAFFSDLQKDGLEIMLVPSVGKSGVWKQLLPNRVNEVPSVYHIKGVIFDEVLLMTGANIGETYLTTRQDRYMIFDIPRLTRHYARMFDEMRPFCIQPFSKYPSPTKPFGDLQQILGSFTHPYCDIESERKADDVLIYFSAQFRGLLRHDEQIMQMILSTTGDIAITSAYLNFPSTFVDRLRARKAGVLDILMAGTEANSFQTNQGPEKYICQTYEHNATELQSTLERARIMQWVHELKDWSFHAKGIWLDTNSREGPVTVCVLGSSNYGRRANERDMETSLSIVTSNENLRRKLAEEKFRLWLHARELDFKPVTRMTRLIAPLLRMFL